MIRQDLHGPPKVCLGLGQSALSLVSSSQEAPGVRVLGIGGNKLLIQAFRFREIAGLMMLPGEIEGIGTNPRFCAVDPQGRPLGERR